VKKLYAFSIYRKHVVYQCEILMKGRSGNHFTFLVSVPEGQVSSMYTLPGKRQIAGVIDSLFGYEYTEIKRLANSVEFQLSAPINILRRNVLLAVLTSTIGFKK
jgi:hypothetical protein